MIIVFFLIIILIITSLKIGISIEKNEGKILTKKVYITILKDIKIYSKPIILKNINGKMSLKKIDKIDIWQLLKELMKNLKIKRLNLNIKLDNSNIILNTYITAIISGVIESVRIIKNIDDIYYKIELSKKTKITIDLKLELYLIDIIKSVMKCINFLNKEKIYTNK